MNLTRSTRLILNLSLLYYKHKLWRNNGSISIKLKHGELGVWGCSCTIYEWDKNDDILSGTPSKLIFRMSNKRDGDTNFIPSPFDKKQYILLGEQKLDIPENITMKEPSKDEFNKVIDILENYEFSASIMIDDSLVRTIKLFLEFNAGFILRMHYFSFGDSFKLMKPEMLEDLERILYMELGDAAY